MNNERGASDPKYHLTQLVQSAAHSAACPAAVFYLCEPEKFEVAANFGCEAADAAAGRDVAVLAAAERHPDGMLVVRDMQLRFPAPANPWLFGDGGMARFVAAVQVPFGRKAACGLLVVADTVPHRPTEAQLQALRTHAAQITLLLEWFNLRERVRQRGGEVELPRPAEAGAMRNRRLADTFFRRARRAEAENITLEQEKTAMEAEIEERRRIEARLHYVAFHDDLTSLHNRQFFIDRVAADLQALTTEPDFRFAVLLLDLDRFKSVNDNLGHRAGDLLLIEIGQRLRSCVRADDVVARIGGDEFAILFTGFEQPSDIAAMTGRLLELMRQPVQLLGQEVYSSISIGAVQASKYYRQPEELLRDADVAMYEAKRQRLGFMMFDDALHRTAMVETRLRTDLQRALARSEFYLEYLPIFNLATREIKGLEALIRWQHPTQGPLQPGAFIGAAEEMGLIRQIGSWILQEACSQMRDWNRQYPGLGLRLGVNISVHQLTDDRFISRLNEILKSTDLDPSLLQLEVTEGAFLPDREQVFSVVGDLRARGVRFTLDDFGTGYSSLAHLDRYPIDAIKIDRSFVGGMVSHSRTGAMVKAILELGRALDLEITAEGIEDDRQSQALLTMGCELAQGFSLSQPLSSMAAARLIQKQVFPAAGRRKPGGLTGG